MVQQEVKLQSTSVKEPQASQEKIRKRAYELYCARNGAPGDEMDDWFKAEGELRSGRGWKMPCNSRKRKPLSGGIDRQG